jgi:hypothetical protein
MVYEYNNSIKLISLPKNIKFEKAPYILPEKFNEIENQTNMEI